LIKQKVKTYLAHGVKKNGTEAGNNADQDIIEYPFPFHSHACDFSEKLEKIKKSVLVQRKLPFAQIFGI